MLRAVGGAAGAGETRSTAFAAVWRNANLRWLELAWAAAIVGHYAFLIAVSVYAYEVGGEKAVGLIFLARLIPAALVAPFAGMLGDRYPRERVLLYTNITRIALVGASAAAVFADADPWVVYGLSIAATIATTPFRSSQAALTPTLARTPEELTAANAVASGIDSIAVFAGPALAGLLLAVASTGVVFIGHGGADPRLGALPAAHVGGADRAAASESSMRRRSPPSGSPDSRRSHATRPSA